MKRATASPANLAILQAEKAGLRIGIYGRLIASAIFAILYSSTTGIVGHGVGLLATAGFAALSAIHLWLMKSGRERLWNRYVLVAVDAAALAWLAARAPLYHGGDVPQILVFRAYGVSYVFFFLAAATLSLSPGLVLWTGATLVAALWTAFAIIVTGMERTVSWSNLPPNYTAADYVALLTDQDFIGTGNRVEESLFILAAAIILALGTRRARTLVRNEARAQFARANLARYVSPDLVDGLAAQSEPFGPVRRQMATVLFVDLVGFTAYAEQRPPEEVITHLRAFHGRVADVVFAHRGTLEDFIGDEVVALFGTPIERPGDAARAIACAEAIRHTIADWNKERAARGLAAVKIGLGVHTGDVVVGTTGIETRLKFTVVGDTVNIASRLQAATRDLGCEALYSVAAMTAAGYGQSEMITAQEVAIRGHQAPIAAILVPLNSRALTLL